MLYFVVQSRCGKSIWNPKTSVQVLDLILSIVWPWLTWPLSASASSLEGGSGLNSIISNVSHSWTFYDLQCHCYKSPLLCVIFFISYNHGYYLTTVLASFSCKVSICSYTERNSFYSWINLRASVIFEPFQTYFKIFISNYSLKSLKT